MDDPLIWQYIERMLIVTGGIVFGILGYKLLDKEKNYFLSGVGLLAMVFGASILTAALFNAEKRDFVSAQTSSGGAYSPLTDPANADYSIPVPMTDATAAAIERERYSNKYPKKE